MINTLLNLSGTYALLEQCVYVRTCQTIMRCIKQIDYDDDYVEMACIITSYSQNMKSNPLKLSSNRYNFEE